jgi:hypothetical protein
MFRKTGRTTVLAAVLAVVGVMAFAAASASAFVVPFENKVVSGSLTPKKLGQPITLPKGGTFNGSANVTITEAGISGTVTGTVVVPPFEASITVLGIPTKVGITFTQVGTTEGSLKSVAVENCGGAEGCINLSVPTKANIGITGLTILGIKTPVKCETSKPVLLNLSADLTLSTLISEGVHFKGTTNVPFAKCAGIFGFQTASLLNSLLSGEASYAINITNT